MSSLTGLGFEAIEHCCCGVSDLGDENQSIIDLVERSLSARLTGWPISESFNLVFAA